MVDLKEIFAGVKPGKALDVGTRLGEFALRLAKTLPEGTEVIGIDCDPAAVAEANEKLSGRGVTFVRMDGAAMDYPDGAFELVAISNTLHHLKNYDEVLDEMLRVLKPGGYFVVNEMFRDNQNPAQQVHEAQHTLEARIDCVTGGYQRRTWKKDEIIRLPLTDVKIIEFTEELEYNKKLAAKNAKLEQEAGKAAGHPEYPALLEEARKIRAQYEKYGIQRCTQLLYIGKKA